MKGIPKTKNVLVLRTDFTNDAVWSDVCKIIDTPDKFNDLIEFKANVDYLSDPKFEGIEEKTIVTLLPKGKYHPIIFVVDEKSISEPEHPILCIDLRYEYGRILRVIPSEVWGIENNLTMSNMDFGEFSNNTDTDGVFRGFDEE